MKYGGNLHATLSETIQLVDNHMVIQYTTDYEAAEGTDHHWQEDKKKLRRIKHEFSEDMDLNLDS